MNRTLTCFLCFALFVIFGSIGFYTKEYGTKYYYIYVIGDYQAGDILVPKYLMNKIDTELVNDLAPLRKPVLDYLADPVISKGKRLDYLKTVHETLVPGKSIPDWYLKQ